MNPRQGFDNWDSYRSVREKLSRLVAARGDGRLRLVKDTSNLFRPRTAAEGTLDMRRLNRVIEVDPEAMTAEVEGMTTFEAFVDATLPRGLRPPVVPELKTITVGGAVSGAGIESSSFRYGLVHENVEEMEVLCADGTVRLCRPDNEHADLFRAIPNSYGTLGYILRLRVKLLAAPPYAALTHWRYRDRVQFLAALVAACGRGAAMPDFVEGVVFAPDDFVLTTARLTDEAGPVSDYTGMGIYYRSLRSRGEDRLTVRDFLWRWDPDWFWCSRSFGMQNPLLRRLLGRWMLRSSSYGKAKALYERWGIEERVTALRRALGRPVELSEQVIQDVEIPIDHAPEFLDFYFREIDIRPCWVCPLRPLAAAADWTLFAMKPGALYLNFGFWGSVRSSAAKAAGHFNRRVERTVQELGGRKSLYSRSYFPEAEFWRIYNGEAYARLKAKYDPRGAFDDLYRKAVLGG